MTPRWPPLPLVRSGGTAGASFARSILFDALPCAGYGGIGGLDYYVAPTVAESVPAAGQGGWRSAVAAGLVAAGVSRRRR